MYFSLARVLLWLWDLSGDLAILGDFLAQWDLFLACSALQALAFTLTDTAASQDHSEGITELG